MTNLVRNRQSELVLVIDELVVSKTDIKAMSYSQLKTLTSFLETEAQLDFVKDNSESEAIGFYIENLKYNL